MIKGVRFILRLILLLIAVVTGVLSARFFYQFHTLTIEQISDNLVIVSSKPMLSFVVGIGLLLFLLAVLGLIMLCQYQIWRYPLSIFMGYIIGAILIYQFYLMRPFEDSALQLNDDIWYLPFIMATALLLRAIIGFKLPEKINKEKSTT